MEHQRSIISYWPQPFSTSSSFAVTPIAGISSIENSNGLKDPRLSNFMTINTTSLTSTFEIQFVSGGFYGFPPFSLALVGINVVDDSVPDVPVDVRFDVQNLNASGAVLARTRTVSHREVLNNLIDEHQIISGGSANAVANSVGNLIPGGSNPVILVTLERDFGAAEVPIEIGYFFIGLDLPICVNPNTFQWGAEVLNERFTSRGLSLKSSDGIIRRSASLDIVDVQIPDIHGQRQAPDTLPSTQQANFMRTIMSNVGQQMLLSPYPHVFKGTPTEEDLLLSMKQNFFSIYGLMDTRLMFNQTEQPGLKARYNTRFQFMEFR